jgi:hypothetical protein
MRDALLEALTKKGVLGEYQWVINIDIVKYVPGDAFSRWLLPWSGPTNLTVEATILNQDGMAAAMIPVERSIVGGGGFTIGAYRYVFNDVANTIVDILTNPSKRNQE